MRNSQPDIMASIRTASSIIPSAVNLEVSIDVRIKGYNHFLLCASLYVISQCLFLK